MGTLDSARLISSCWLRLVTADNWAASAPPPAAGVGCVREEEGAEVEGWGAASCRAGEGASAASDLREHRSLVIIGNAAGIAKRLEG